MGGLHPNMIKNGIETMIYLTEWYRANSGGAGVGFFQIGGGTAGDFPICVVPMMAQDLEWKDVPLWSYFCQISDSTPGASSPRTLPALSSSQMRPSLLHSFSHTFSAGKDCWLY